MVAIAHSPENALPLKQAAPKPHTPEWQMQELGHRYYSPKLGRWISRDPIGEMGGLLLYGFVGNQPVNQADLVGMSGLTWAALAVILDEVAGTYFIVDPPCWFVMWLTPKLLPKGLPRQLWGRAANGGGDLEITEADQSSWDNAVNRVKGSTEYNSAVDSIKEMVCDDDIAAEDEAVLLHFDKTSDPSLSAALGRAWSNYEYDPASCKLSLWISDVYDFDKNHMWKKCQEAGKLTAFNVKIIMPDIDFSCSDDEE